MDVYSHVIYSRFTDKHGLAFLQAILNGMTVPKWEIYLKDLPKNEELLRQLAYVNGKNDSVPRWCTEVKNRRLDQMSFSDNWIRDFLVYSSKGEYAIVRKMATSQYQRLLNEIGRKKT